MAQPQTTQNINAPTKTSFTIFHSICLSISMFQSTSPHVPIGIRHPHAPLSSWSIYHTIITPPLFFSIPTLETTATTDATRKNKMAHLTTAHNSNVFLSNRFSREQQQNTQSREKKESDASKECTCEAEVMRKNTRTSKNEPSKSSYPTRHRKRNNRNARRKIHQQCSKETPGSAIGEIIYPSIPIH
ncbi:hypothetical protein EYC80_008180 [Monilinia laxa]|uniref:Uncharacterized protein n=1 Tax=Monilinia laxa TaxID=61186 RepID=A0A5N6JVM6_MONLA|nr:hypothetical protein EYC80_008180 [Monilinia laxa]